MGSFFKQQYIMDLIDQSKQIENVWFCTYVIIIESIACIGVRLESGYGHPIFVERFDMWHFLQVQMGVSKFKLSRK